MSDVFTLLLVVYYVFIILVIFSLKANVVTSRRTSSVC